MIAAIVAIGIVVITLALTEVSLRFLRVTDVPLYAQDDLVGYRPAPQHAGKFLRRIDFEFNELGLGVGTRFAPGGDDILLVGDSLVHGGTFFRQPERLGPQLSKLLGRTVWPAGAVSWSFKNELEFVFANPKLLQVSTIIFVLNSQDLGEGSTWRGEAYHPTRRPALATVFVARKLLARFQEPRQDIDATPNESIWCGKLLQLLSLTEGRVLIVLVPKRSDIGGNVDRFALLRRPLFEHKGASILDLSGAWRQDYFLDELHQNREGNLALARAIAAELSIAGETSQLRRGSDAGPH